MASNWNVRDQWVKVIGLGVSGRAAAQLLLDQGAHVEAFDDAWESMQSDDTIIALQKRGLKVQSNPHKVDLHGCFTVVVSPGVSQEHPLYSRALVEKVPVIGEVELACRFLPNRMMAVTGSNGKTTVASLIAHLLNGCGYVARAVGNIGIPLAGLVNKIKAQEILIVELSSYQLETIRSHVFEMGTILNITPNHLDRYPSMESYAAAKLHLRHLLKNWAPLYMRDHEAKQYKSLIGTFPVRTIGYTSDCTLYCDGERIIFQDKVEHVLPTSYRGAAASDLDNLLAAYAFCREVGAHSDAMWEALNSFEKPPHRVQFVREIGEISFYDDSKATSIDAVTHAVTLMKGQVVLIAGGLHKGAPYTSWIDSFQGKVKHIYAIGQAAVTIKQDMSGSIPVTLCTTLAEAVEKAAHSAVKGDNVLLSPGCSSYDMFKDYAHRGEEFQRLVCQLDCLVKEKR